MTVDVLAPPDLTLREVELLRRRAHVLAEIERTLRRPALRLALGAAAVIAAAAAVLLVAERPGPTRLTLVDQALSALGTGPTIHVVLTMPQAAELVDMRTGRARAVAFRQEFWADPTLGTLYVRTLGGRIAQRLVFPPSAWGVGVRQWQPFITGYRTQLERGTFHVVGRGRIGGNDVEWIASKTPAGRAVEQIAISTATYRPLFIRLVRNGHVLRDISARVVVAESLPRRPSLFAHAQSTPQFGGGQTSSAGGQTGIPTTLAAARAAMRPGPFVPAATIDGLRRTWLGLPDYLLPPGTSYKDQVNGLTLYYGQLDGYGYPRYDGRYIAINEVPRQRDAEAIWGEGFFRRGDAVVVTPPGTRETVATVRVRGLFVAIQASDPHAAVAAARALGR
jgi:hypothetical protein